MRRVRSTEAFARARRVSPGGVHSPVRAFKAVGGTPVFFQRGEGSHCVDVDGNRYLDLCMSWGPLILGHADPQVIAEVQDAATRGLSFGACHRGEAELCERIVAGVPGAARARLVSSGTEAVMAALRLARGVTERPLVLKFAGGYHGHADALLVEAGSGLATSGVATSAGIAEETAATTVVTRFDDEKALRRAFEKHGADLAAAIVEPYPANNGLLVQRPEWLGLLRELCDEHGTILILDEVITGFRLRPGSAGPLVGVKGDLVTMGKIVGGGMPIGAVAGPAKLMDRFAPVGDVYQAGTLSGNPVSVAAGLATLRRLDDGAVHAGLEELGARLEGRLAQGPDWLQVRRVGSILWLYLAEGPIPRRADRIDPAVARRFRTLHGRLLDRGYYLPPSSFEVLFLSTAHRRRELDAFADALLEEADRLGDG